MSNFSIHGFALYDILKSYINDIYLPSTVYIHNQKSYENSKNTMLLYVLEKLDCIEANRNIQLISNFNLTTNLIKDKFNYNVL